MRFSIGSILMVTTILCLSAALVNAYQKLTHVQRELVTLRPLSLEEVARQFEQRTTLGPVSATVKDVRYSPSEDAYRVTYGWTDANTGKTWISEVTLAANGFGTYWGTIRDTSFLQPLGYKDRFTVSVEPPSMFPE